MYGEYVRTLSFRNLLSYVCIYIYISVYLLDLPARIRLSAKMYKKRKKKMKERRKEGGWEIRDKGKG